LNVVAGNLANIWVIKANAAKSREQHSKIYAAQEKHRKKYL